MMHGPAGTENDMPFIENLYISGAERRALENLQKGRSRTSVSKCLPRTYIEEMLERMLQVNGEQGLNKFRDSARIVSESLGMTAEFETLFSALHNEQFPFIDEPNVENAAFRNFAFFESYFSNYIEGTEFELEDAWQIVESGLPMPARNADSHDVLGTFQLVASRREMRRTPKSSDELIELLQDRHRVLMTAQYILFHNLLAEMDWSYSSRSLLLSA